MDQHTNHRSHSRFRRGALSLAAWLMIVSFLVFMGLGWLALQLRPDSQRKPLGDVEVRVYCAAGLAKPVEQAIDAYRKTYGVQVELARTSGSGRLYGQIETEAQTGVERGADLYVTADDGLLENGHRAGIIAEQIPLAFQRPVIAVRMESKLEIDSLRDLVNQSPLIEFGVTNDGAAIGRLTRNIAERDGYLKSLIGQAKTESENVMALAQALQNGSLDAAVVWDTTVMQINQQHDSPVLKIAASADSQGLSVSNIALGVVAGTQHPTAVLRFARYLSAVDQGLLHFQNAGFDIVDGDHWEEFPEIHLFCGSMFTPVIEETVRSFASREGVNIYPRWEGCGKLVSAMQSLEDPSLFPDAYLACDQQFLDRVHNAFEPAQVISANQLVLAVRRDSPFEIAEPNDLVQQGLRVGICHPDESALGYLTMLLLSQSPFTGLYEKVKSHAVVTVDVGPTLISQLLAGGLDVAIVYRSNVVSNPSNLRDLKFIPIDDQGANTSRAIQPWAIAKNSQHKQLMGRLFEVLISDDSQSKFDAAGFHWSYKR